MSDKIMDSLRQAFMKDKENIVDECHMADQTSAYAFGELGPEESGKVKDHLNTCRYCLDLFMDIRMAEEEAKDEKVEVLPRLQSAIDKDKKPVVSILQKIGAAISDFFGKGFSLKPVAAFATVLLILGGIYMLQDKSGSPYAIQIMLQGRTQSGFRGGQPEYNEFQVKPGGEMKSGDYFRFQTKIDKDAYVYVVFQDSSGSIESLEKGLIAGGKDFFLPDGNKWYHLDKNTGTEKLYLLASKNKIEDFAKRIEDLKSGGIETIGKIFPKATVQSFSFEHQ
ncbi:MAG: DUF4384 domain-containing protein [Pseudomonadota bacterium]